LETKVSLSRLKKLEVFEKFLDDLFINGQIEQLSLNAGDLLDVISNIQEFNLDFDDAYQLSVSRKYDLVIVTFDNDFNIKGIKKNTPEEIILRPGTTDWEPFIA
jgi:predicted nucleic acid-binding protein